MRRWFCHCWSTSVSSLGRTGSAQSGAACRAFSIAGSARDVVRTCAPVLEVDLPTSCAAPAACTWWRSVYMGELTEKVVGGDRSACEASTARRGNAMSFVSRRRRPSNWMLARGRGPLAGATGAAAPEGGGRLRSPRAGIFSCGSKSWTVLAGKVLKRTRSLLPLF